MIPVTLNGGSSFGSTLETIGQYATVDTDHALQLSRSSVPDSQQTIRDWAENL